jgi:predicted phage terminase large subunit-like protein
MAYCNADTSEYPKAAVAALSPPYCRANAETLWPEQFAFLHSARESIHMLDQIRKTIGEYNFAGQYQQAPAPLGGGLVKAAWFQHCAQDEMPATFDRVVQSWDTASKATELSDFSVCTSWGILGKDLYLLDVLRRRTEELERAVREQYARFRPNVVLIEDKASGTQLIQELVQDGLYAVTRYQPQSDKVMRLHAQTAMIENGFLTWRRGSPSTCTR